MTDIILNIFCFSEYDYITLNDLEVIGTLGIGGFGRVELVQYVKNPSLTFALKCLKKQHIVDTQQQDHVLSERSIMLSCRSLFICRFVNNTNEYNFLQCRIFLEIQNNKTKQDSLTHFYFKNYFLFNRAFILKIVALFHQGKSR